jgi:hypothetical protein
MIRTDLIKKAPGIVKIPPKAVKAMVEIFFDGGMRSEGKQGRAD